MATVNASNILSYVAVLAQLLETGKTSFTKIRGFLQQEGATPEQLADLDARLTKAIADREAPPA